MVLRSGDTPDLCTIEVLATQKFTNVSMPMMVQLLNRTRQLVRWVGSLAKSAMSGLRVLFEQRARAATVVASLIGLLRTWSGWVCIVLGLFFLPLPIPFGIPLLVTGTLLLGTRSPAIRLSFLHIRLFLRRWARSNIPVLGTAGFKLLQVQRQVARSYRTYRRRLARQRRLS